MKKKMIALLLSVTMLCSAFVPYTYAVDLDTAEEISVAAV